MEQMVSERVPVNWVMADLKGIAQINPRHQKDLDFSTEVTFVPMKGVSDKHWQFNFSETRKYFEVRKNFTHFAENDVLFAKITPCMENGKAAVAKNLVNGLGCGTTELHILRSYEGIEPFYIYYFLKQESFRKEAYRNMTGTAGQLRVPVDFIQKSQIPVAPTNEQRRIVAKLEKLLQKVDACTERLDKIPTILKRFRQSVLAAACSGRLTEDWRGDSLNGNGYPLSWNQKKLAGFIESMRNGIYKPEKYYSDDGTISLRMYNIQNGHIIWANLKRMNLTSEEITQYGLIPGDILVNRVNSRELVGKAAIIEQINEPVVFESKNIRLRLIKGKINQRYVNYCFMTRIVRDIFEDKSKQTVGMATISQPQIANLILPMPPLKEQNEIVRRIEALFKIADQVEERYNKARVYIDKLTQSILAKAFRGELVPQDPTDEPASELLKLIKEEKACKVSMDKRKQKRK